MQPTVRVVGEEVTEPDPSGTAEAFSQSGYRFEQAVADLVDNSIDAGARSVLIRFLVHSSTIRSIVTADDGKGMDTAHLRRAMQYGARVKRSSGDLGKYGVGMKSASLSQCRSMSVISRQGGMTSGRRWTEESIRTGWRCEVLDPGESARFMDQPWGDLSLAHHGTLIVWDGLDRLRADRAGINATITSRFRLLSLHLGLVFHRFLAAGRLTITLDRLDTETWSAGLPATVDPLDPFDYQASGDVRFPLDYVAELPGLKLGMRAHVWPPKSKSVGYRLGGGQVAARQGFYFYRNDRLIQGGGWNGWRDSDNEPHLSLARVAVELPAAADRTFGLSLHKSIIDVPHGFLASLDRMDSDGLGFRDYIAAALEAYRSANAQAEDVHPVPVLGAGIASPLKKRSRRVLAPRVPNVTEVDFRWADLPEGRVFDLEHGSGVIRLNSKYRSIINGHKRNSVNDAQLVKVLIFLALRSQLRRERASAASRRELDDFNAIIRAAIGDLQ